MEKAEGIIDELIESKTDPYNGRATADEVKPQIFMYEIITPATASNEDVDGVTKLADTSEGLKIASTKPTAKITGINYTEVFGSLPEYTANLDNVGSGTVYPTTETTDAKFENYVRENYSKLVIPAKVKLNANGECDENGIEYTIIDVDRLGGDTEDQWYVGYANGYFAHNVYQIVLPNTIRRFIQYIS